jgi:hypothetical protein
MKPFIFIGPSLSLDRAKKHLDAVFLPPVKFGDIYRIVRLYNPQIIGVIDGYFNQVPAVWHKEILWAINQGACVYGAASMGALRAAELDALGMIGCGKIYQAYQKSVLPPYVDEVFEDDDEVAVTHAPAEMGYTPLSEAMVNIRVTLARAHQQQIIDLQTRNSLIRIAKNLFYPQRRFRHIIDLAQKQGITESMASHISHWIDENRVDQKQADAISLLEAINHQPQANDNHPKNSHTDFVHTSQWQTAINEIDQSHRIEPPALNEIRLQGPRYFRLLDLALNSVFAQSADAGRRDHEDITSLHRSTDALDNHLNHDWRLMNNQSTLALLSVSESDQCLLKYLEQTDELVLLQQRALDKQSTLEDKTIPDVTDLTDIELLQLGDWYFNQVLDRELPDRPEGYAADLGFTDMDAFYDMILREYYYTQE